MDKPFDVLLPQFPEDFRSDLLAAFGDDLPGRGVGDVGDDHLADEIVRRQQDPAEGDTLAGVPFDALLADLHALLEGDLPRLGGVTDLHGHLQPNHQLRAEILGVLFPLEGHLLRIVEDPQKLFGGPPERAQQHGDGELPLPVDLDVERVLVVELEIEPRTAIRDDPRAEQDFPRRVGAAFVVLEEDARRPVQLADDDPLGAVDDERGPLGHERDLPEEDLLLLDVPDGPRPGLLVHVEDDQLDRHLDGGGVRHPALAALLFRPLQLSDRVGEELEGGAPVVVRDGEDTLEDGLEPDVPALLGRNVRLQELRVRLLLNLYEVRDLLDLLVLREVHPLDPVPVIQIGHRVTPGIKP